LYIAEVNFEDMRMSNTGLPFLITVCGIDELPGHSDREVSHVLSILDPGEPEPHAFGSYGEHARLELRFHDIIEEAPGYDAPQRHHVEQILLFGRDIMSEPETLRHLLVHCHMGISRSTASMSLLLAVAQPERPASDILNLMLQMREKAWPNLRILNFGEEMLGRPGEFSAAAAEVYRQQLALKPEIADFHEKIGRGREVALARGE
jgi:predicted protein tyrosine phosphatase